MSVSNLVKNSFIAGLALLAPLIVTVLTVQFVLWWLVRVIDPILQGTRLVQYTANIEIVAQILAVVLLVGGIVAVGYLAQRSLGDWLFGGLDRAVNVVPLVRVIYSIVRQVVNALMEGDSRYERVVLVEYPRGGTYSVGFVTGDSPGAVEPVTGGPAYNVFLPNSPNPTAGRLVLVPPEDVHEIDMSVRRGIGLLVTTGITEAEDDQSDRANPSAAVFARSEVVTTPITCSASLITGTWWMPCSFIRATADSTGSSAATLTMSVVISDRISGTSPPVSASRSATNRTMSERVRMPFGCFSSSTTIREPMLASSIAPAASVIGASGSIVTTGDVMIAPADCSVMDRPSPGIVLKEGGRPTERRSVGTAYMYAESHRVGLRVLPQLSQTIRPIESMAFASSSQLLQ